MRGRRPGGRRARGRHAGLRLFDRHHRAALPGVRRGPGGGGRRRRCWSPSRSRPTAICRSCACWPTWAAAPTPSRKARSAARWPRACPPRGSSSPASASPTASSPSPWRRASSRSMWRPPRSCGAWRRSRRRGASQAPVAIRVNPGLGAGAHEKITTGGAGDKFGVTAGRGAGALSPRRRGRPRCRPAASPATSAARSST